MLVLPDQLASLVKCIENLGKDCLTGENMVELVAVIDRLMNEHFFKEEERVEKRKET